MSRGIVMETGPKYAIVMTPDGQFRKVPTGRKLQIGEEFSFSERRRYAHPRKLHSFSIGAAAILLLLFVPFLLGRIGQGPEVVAYLTMDVNPSIELGVTEDEHVVELRAINDDGADVTEGLAYKGLPLDQVAEEIMDRIGAGTYLNSGEGDVIITSVMIAEPDVAEYENLVTEHMDAAVRKSLKKLTDEGRSLKVEVTKIKAPKEIREEAEHDGLSAGKLAFYLIAKELGYNVTLQELKTQSIHQTAKPWGGVKAVINEQTKPAVSSAKDDDSNKAEDKKVSQTTESAINAEQKKELREQLKELLKKEKENRSKDDDNNKHRDDDDKKGSSSSKKNNESADNKNIKKSSGSSSIPAQSKLQKGSDNRKDDSVREGDDDDNGDRGRGDDSGGDDDRNKDRDDDHKGGREEGNSSSDGRHNGVFDDDDKKQDDKIKKNSDIKKDDNRNKDRVHTKRE
ncbi:anti-sigma factor domain-containing protein [Paenibacillus montanisoli]|uniref:RsgI N-terminal anti-sigma domain-containing protein n=1 Tax=Paenibacillus montanisoli TaxID=2081970 RepID=A0A328UA69_9BACL|nr:anti-sigma factor domain-containing protein [Paenibacillus montanisoli]RAP77124.1 hypothetical protein DL346_01060 [Paenibacillus montanisoli]